MSMLLLAVSHSSHRLYVSATSATAPSAVPHAEVMHLSPECRSWELWVTPLLHLRAGGGGAQGRRRCHCWQRCAAAVVLLGECPAGASQGGRHSGCGRQLRGTGPAAPLRRDHVRLRQAAEDALVRAAMLPGLLPDTPPPPPPRGRARVCTPAALR